MNEQRILRCAPDMSVTKVGRDYLQISSGGPDRATSKQEGRLRVDVETVRQYKGSSVEMGSYSSGWSSESFRTSR